MTPKPENAASALPTRSAPQPLDDPRNPEFIGSVFTRCGRHLHVMERYAEAGGSHTWLAMARDTLEAICLLAANQNQLLDLAAQLTRQGGKTTAGAQASLEQISKRLAALEKAMTSILTRLEEIEDA